MNGHGVGMPTQHGDHTKHRQEHVGNVFIHGILFGLQNSDLGESLQDLGIMRCSPNICSQILSRLMSHHVGACFPQLTLGDIIYFPVVSYVHRLSLFTVVRGKFFPAKLLQRVLHVASSDPRRKSLYSMLIVNLLSNI